MKLACTASDVDLESFGKLSLDPFLILKLLLLTAMCSILTGHHLLNMVSSVFDNLMTPHC